MRILDVLKPWFLFRDASTGRFVSRVYALMNPGTTVRERVTRLTKLERAAQAATDKEVAAAEEAAPPTTTPPAEDNAPDTGSYPQWRQ